MSKHSDNSGPLQVAVPVRYLLQFYARQPKLCPNKHEVWISNASNADKVAKYVLQQLHQQEPGHREVRARAKQGKLISPLPDDTAPEHFAG